MPRTNVRSVYRSGRSTVVSLPNDLLDEMGLALGDDVIFEYDGESAEMHKATISVASETSGDDA
jgi:antitoxin component of MazEF toxin-antitoxin module